MAALNFLLRGKREVTVAHFNHGTEHGGHAEAFITEFCDSHSLSLVVGRVSSRKKKSESQEAFWRRERYAFFDSLGVTPIVTCHHLDDVVETWIMTSLHGQSRVIPPVRGRFLRPFLLTRKADLRKWAVKHMVLHIHDLSNDDTKYMRNLVRHKIVPEALVVNPGLHRVVARRVREEMENPFTWV